MIKLVSSLPVFFQGNPGPESFVPFSLLLKMQGERVVVEERCFKTLEDLIDSSGFQLSVSVKSQPHILHYCHLRNGSSAWPRLSC